MDKLELLARQDALLKEQADIIYEQRLEIEQLKNLLEAQNDITRTGDN